MKCQKTKPQSWKYRADKAMLFTLATAWKSQTLQPLWISNRVKIAKAYNTLLKTGNSISNGKLSRAAAALLVKSVRVGVGLSDLLEIRRLQGNSATLNKKLMN